MCALPVLSGDRAACLLPAASSKSHRGGHGVVFLVCERDGVEGEGRGRYRNRDKETSREIEIASQHIPLQGDPTNDRYYLLGLSKPQGL